LPRSRRGGDTARFCARRNPQQRARLADADQPQERPGSADRARHRVRQGRAGRSRDDECHRRHQPSLLGQHWRLNPWDFKVVSETKRRYGASRIPKGSTIEDWPFGYDELEQYYDKIEYEVGVSGQGR